MVDVLEWPGEQRIMELYKQVSGFFIRAVTVVKFIRDQVDVIVWQRVCLKNSIAEAWAISAVQHNPAVDA